MKLRNMSATVSTGETITLENATVLTSYASRVAVYSAREMRYNAENELHGGEYRFADGIVLASGYVERY